jgi:hypothetical protein
MQRHPHRRTLHRLAALSLLAGVAWSAQAQDNTVCGPEVKSAVAKQLDEVKNLPEAQQLEAQAKIYDQYKYCAQDGANLPPSDPFFRAVRQCGGRVPLLGSLYYEEMSCCGYDPQRRTFTCPVKVKQNFGFGAAPNPGSRLYTLHCVADTSGALRPVGHDSVHLADSQAAPPWQFGVVANAVDNLQTVQPMNGQSRRARSILSWNLKPTGCEYQPIWGNAIDYRIRLDP